MVSRILDILLLVLCLNYCQSFLFFDTLNALLSQTTHHPIYRDDCRHTEADIVFLLDASSSMRPAGFSDVLHLVNKLVGKFTISRSNVQVGVVTFSSTPHLEFDLNRYADDHHLHDAIHHISFTAHQTDTLAALKYVESSSFEHGRGARSSASHIVILITDGVVIHSSHYPSHQSSGHVTPSSHHGYVTHSSHVQEGPAELDHIIGLMQRKGIDVIAIGVHVHNSNLLRRIARDSSNYFAISNSSELTIRTNAVAQRICAVTRQRKITTTQVPSTTKTTHTFTLRTESTTISTTHKVTTPSTTHKVTTPSTTHQVTTPSTTHKDLSCVDKVDNCYQFETYYCMPPYDTWAKTNCPAYCGYCNGGSPSYAYSTVTTAGTTTTADVTTTPDITTATTTIRPATSTTTQISQGSVNKTVCPTCDEFLSCVWNQTCDLNEVCMVRSVPGRKFSTHCIRTDDCEIMKSFAKSTGEGEIFCCSNRECLWKYLGV